MAARTCAACGTTERLGPALGGVLLCRDHYADINLEIEALRDAGQPVDVTKIARRMLRESATTYLLRDVPDDLWAAAKHRAVDEDLSLRDLLLKALRQYLG